MIRTVLHTVVEYTVIELLHNDTLAIIKNIQNNCQYSKLLRRILLQRLHAAESCVSGDDYTVMHLHSVVRPRTLPVLPSRCREHRSKPSPITEHSWQTPR